MWLASELPQCSEIFVWLLCLSRIKYGSADSYEIIVVVLPFSEVDRP